MERLLLQIYVADFGKNSTKASNKNLHFLCKILKARELIFQRSTRPETNIAPEQGPF